MTKWSKYQIVSLAILLVAQVADGACSSPSGGAGQLQLDGGIMKWCNGSAWQNATGPSLGSCSGVTAGTISFQSGTLSYCNGTTRYSMHGSGSLAGTCSPVNSYQYEPGNSRYVICTSSGLIPMYPGTVAACGAGGQQVAGKCWYLGAAGDSCVETCNARGGVDNATLTYVGTSGGNAGNCGTVLQELGYGSGSASSSSNCPGPTEGPGCALVVPYNYRYYVTCPSATVGFSSSSYRRVCACAQ